MKSSFDADTDKRHELKLESKILYALWKHGVARGGAEAQLEVRTVFVGQGAEIEITGKSSRGKAPGKIKGKVLNNRFIGRLPVPGNVDPEGVVWFEAKLPRHGLKTESNKIPAAPPIVLKSMKWDREEVWPGDMVNLTAEFEPPISNLTEAMVVVKEHDVEGSHHTTARIPAQVSDGAIELCWVFDYHEDTMDIPTENEMQKVGGHYYPPKYFFVVEIDGEEYGKDQESGLLAYKDRLTIEWVDSEGKPAAGRQFKLKKPDGSEEEVTTDDEGNIVLGNLEPGPKLLASFPAMDTQR